MRVVLVLLLAACAQRATASDVCASLVPSALGAQLVKAYGGYRLPRETDNLSEDVAYNREHGGTGCLGVATGDFDGDTLADYVLGLTQIKGDGAMIVVALSRAGHCELHRLDTWKDERSRLYVSSDTSGTFERFAGFDGPPEKGEVEELRCTHAAVIYGTTESTGVAYCFSKGRWKHTWFSD